MLELLRRLRQSSYVGGTLRITQLLLMWNRYMAHLDSYAEIAAFLVDLGVGQKDVVEEVNLEEGFRRLEITSGINYSDDWI